MRYIYIYSTPPIINIVEEVAKETARIGARQVLLLGTAQTMKSRKFRETFRKYGITATAPETETAKSRLADLIRDLQQGEHGDAAVRLSQIAKQSLVHHLESPDSVVCLACTELPLAFPNMKRMSTFEHDNVLYINSSIVKIAFFGLLVPVSADGRFGGDRWVSSHIDA